MATRSLIGKVENGIVKAIYCHSDGYGHLPILEKHYNTEEKVDELIALGDLSVLGSLVNPPIGATHSFNNHYPEVCVAYHRDRGEDLNITEINEFSVNRIAKKDFGAEYVYLFNDGKWSKRYLHD
jgi:hypothetical protein